MAENSPQNEFDAAAVAPTTGVGQSLKAARERMGRPLPEVAAQLRIRQPFLQALEDGRHRDLPGGTYAIGFLRTYAEFLGLDGEEMVRRFRAEAVGEFAARSELLFPLPSSEGRIPGGAVLFIGLVLSAVAYGAWYWLTARQSTVAEMVPALPERLSSVLHRPVPPNADSSAKTGGSKAENGVSAPQSAEERAMGASKEAEMVPPSEAEDEPKPQPQIPAPVEAPKHPQLKPAPVETATAKPMDVVKPVAAPASEPTKPVTPVVAAPPQAPTPPAAPVAVASSPAVPAPAAPLAPLPEGKVIGQENADSRIRLTATADDCWVQVREMDGQLTLSRLLRRGESVMLPNRPGLTLMVGNAGALDVIVDGRKAPALGTAGQIRRDIKMDPDKLLVGG